MKKAPIHPNEDKRLEALYKIGILDTKPEPEYDTLTKEAVSYFNVPISTISIIDKDREWYKSCQGTIVRESDRDSSFCGHALFASGNIFIIEDTLKDERFADNPQVLNEPHVRFYAGVALLDNKSGFPVGVFCIKDIKPRTLNTKEIAKLLDLSSKAENILNNKNFA